MYHTWEKDQEEEEEEEEEEWNQGEEVWTSGKDNVKWEKENDTCISNKLIIMEAVSYNGTPVSTAEETIPLFSTNEPKEEEEEEEEEEE